MPKKKSAKKSFAELELESYATDAPDIHVDRDKEICKLIKKHMDEVTAAKDKYLRDDDIDQYERYAEVEAAFYILVEDLRKEGLYVD